MKPASFGNALVEYGLSLVVLFGLGGILGTFTDFPDRIKQYFQSNQYGSFQGNTLHISGLGTGVVQSQTTLPMQSASPNNPNSNPNPNQVCLSSGICVQVPVIASGPLTETNGGLGGNLTNSLADVLDQVVAQLQAQGADPTLINLITNLANEGHNVGNQVTTLQNACPAGSFNCNIDAFGAYRNVIQGNQIGNTNSYSFTLDTASFQQAKQAVDQYFLTHPNTFSSVSTLINLESTQIMNISNGVSVKTAQANFIGSAGVPPYEVTMATNNATLIHQNANTICSSGGHTSVCLQQNPNASLQVPSGP